MSTAQPYSLLVVEPNEKLTHPYNLIPSTYHITRVSTIAEALNFVSHTLPTAVMLSSSIKPADSVSLLEKVAGSTHTHLPKLIFVVDLGNPLNTIPGTTWGDSTEVLTSRSSLAMVKASLAQD